MATSSIIPSVYGRARSAARSKAAKRKYSAQCAHKPSRPGLLTERISPIVTSPHGTPSAIALGFYWSLNLLRDYYKFELPSHKGELPEVITKVVSELTEFLEKQHKVELMVLLDEDGHIFLGTAEVFSTGQTLYYLAVRPVWQLSLCEAESTLFNLALALYAFVYHLHNMPYFTEPGYLDQQYEVLQNWADESEDEADKQWQLGALEKLQENGREILTLIGKAFEIGDLARALDAYKVSPDADSKIIGIANEALEITAAFPGRNLVADIPIDLRYSEEESRVYPDQYISFYWSGNDQFYDALIDMISSELQEYGVCDEPAHYNLFNGNPITKADFSFEKRMLVLICDLNEFLDPYDNEEYHSRSNRGVQPLESTPVLQTN